MTDPNSSLPSEPSAGGPSSTDAYGAPTAAAPYPVASDAPVPGRTLGIVALVVSFFAALVGLILGLVAQSQSKKAGVPNTPAKVAIILSIVFMVLWILLIVILWFTVWGPLMNACAGLGPGVYQTDGGVTLTCG